MDEIRYAAAHMPASSSPSSARCATHLVAGLPICVLAAPGNDSASCRRTIYAGNLSPDIRQEDIIAFFSACGQVKFVRITGDGAQPTR
jgi:hypothetical protein